MGRIPFWKSSTWKSKILWAFLWLKFFLYLEVSSSEPPKQSNFLNEFEAPAASISMLDSRFPPRVK